MSDNDRVDFGFVFAMPMEAGGLVDLLEDRITTKGNGRVFHRGCLSISNFKTQRGQGGNSKFQIAIVESGIGQAKAASATNALLDIFCPKFIISAGYAGGLSPEFKKFSVHQPDLLLRKSDGMIIDVANHSPQVIKKIAYDNSNINDNNKDNNNNDNRFEINQNIDNKYNIVTKNRNLLVTVDQPVETTERKFLLGKEYNAGLVDMETFAVAEVCVKRQNERNSSNEIIRFSSIRIVLDAVDDELPKEVKRIIQSYDRSTARMIGATIGSIFKRPSVVFDLYSLKERALRATDILAKYIQSNIFKF
jgi:adenosylhomocysteine nucleosidase